MRNNNNNTRELECFRLLTDYTKAVEIIREAESQLADDRFEMFKQRNTEILVNYDILERILYERIRELNCDDFYEYPTRRS